MKCHLCQRMLEYTSLFEILSIPKAYCKICSQGMERASHENCCTQCGSKFPLQEQLCENCLLFREEYHLAFKHFAVFSYNDFWREYVWKIKHDCNYFLITELACLLRGALEKQYSFQQTVFVPYPTDISSLSYRGFNFPYALLCEAGVPVQDFFEKIPQKEKQHKNDLKHRLKNREQILRVKNNIQLTSHKKIVLFDDIYTSGATMMSGILTLKRANISCYDSASLFR